MQRKYLPVSLITPLRLQDILDNVNTAIQKTNPNYNIVMKMALSLL